MNDADRFAREIVGILEEIEVYDRYRSSLLEALKKAAKEYRSGKYGYIGHESIRQSILKGKTEQEWKEHYSSYIYSLLKRIELLLNELELRIREEREKPKTGQTPHPAEIEIKSIERYYENQRQRQPTPQRYASDASLDARLSTIKAKLAGKMQAYAPENIRYAIVKRPAHKAQTTAALQAIQLPQEAEEDFLPEPEASIDQHIQAQEAMQTAEQGQLAKPKAPFSLSPLFLVMKKIRNGIMMLGQGALKLPAKAGGLLKSIHLPKIQREKQAEKKAFQKAEEELDFSKFTEHSKVYSKQRIRTVQQAAVRKEPVFAGILKKARGAGVFALKAPLQAGKAAIFVAKLPVKASLGAVRIAFLSAQLIGKLRKKKPQKEAGQKEREPFLGKMRSVFQPKKTIFVEEIVGMEKEAAKSDTAKITRKTPGILSGSVLNIKLVSDIISRFRKKDDKIVGEQTEIPEHIKKLREMRARLRDEKKDYGFEQTLLAQESRRVREIIEAGKNEPYKGSSFGAMANIFVKKTSVSLVNTFPELFEYLYNALRTANIKILSNTYVSIMVFVSISLFLTVTAALSAIFFLLNYPLYEVVLRSFFFGFIAAAAAAIFFYAYPFIKISERRKNITANMPFAINHLAAVSASGVPPASMLELISDSKEYGEIAVEFKKIVDLINVFGYDLLTAIRTISATTPSPAFKEVLDGMVSTIETGGDLESYLNEKAEEATLTYKLERQRYNESISTYSDIYTGVLIAAPLFFVAALAIINLLGGTIAGFGIEAIMAFGAYIAIPMLNIAFLLFLQMNQPEV